MKKNLKNIFALIGNDDKIFSKERLKFVLVVLFFIYIILVCKVLYLSINPNTDINTSYNDNYKSENKRINILDKNGVILAADVDLLDFYLERNLVSSPKNISKKINKIFPDVNEEKLYEKLINIKNKSRYILVKRNITPRQVEEIKQAEIVGFEFMNSITRLYPHKNLFSHVIGYVNIEKNGVDGIEKQYNKYLNNYTNKPLVTTLDVRIQTVLRQKLLEAQKKYKAKSILGIVSEIKTGNILAMVILPDFNPNQASLSDRNDLFNKATYGVYEMGSIFKIFTIALGLDKNIIKENKMYDISQVISFGKHKVKQKYYTKKFLNPNEILTKSSNVGAGLIGLEIGTPKMKEFLNSLGLFDKVPSNFPALAKPLLPKVWKEVNTLTVSYGYGIAVSPLHIVMAVNGIVNNGILKTPKFVNDEIFEDKKIVKEKTSKTINKYLRNAVINGTGWRANSLGYSVGGKTGSARILKNGKYEEGNIIANFIGIFPMNDPNFSIYIMIESPSFDGLSSEDVAGGTVAAPIFARIVENIAPILNVIPYIKRIE
jgi:cell division protein FtsI (penicillin-binding protein 3)